jgi:hypothetical protein
MLRVYRWIVLAAGLAAAVNADTNIFGTITTTTWTAVNQPYHVTGTITVLAGNTLTIEAGVDVLFDADVQFIVEGQLVAIGTETDSIRFIRGISSEWGGLRLIDASDSSTIHYARISDGLAEGDDLSDFGGAVFLKGARLGISHSVITGNRAYIGAGLAALDNCVLTVYSCKITKNNAQMAGGGVWGSGDSWTAITESLVNNNTSLYVGGGVGVADHATVDITDCTIADNTAIIGGGFFASDDGATASLRRCLISGNSAAAGGGLFLSMDCLVSLDNCTVFANIASESGGEIYAETRGTGQITNSIVWDNTHDDIHKSPDNPGTITATYSDIGGGFTGTGNIDADPLFIDVASGDFRLQVISPCIDTGDPASPLDPDGSRVDMGAFTGEPPPDGPWITVSPHTLYISTTQPETLVVRNVGTLALDVTGFPLPDSFTTDQTFPVTINPSGRVDIIVNYIGTSGASGTAVLTHSVEAQPDIDIALHGIVGTTVTGTITTTTWTAANQPYRVSGAITIPTGNTLTIEPGVDVVFDADVQFVIEGRLVALGTEKDSVRFLRGVSPEWGGLLFLYTGDSSTIHYARISDGVATGTYPSNVGGAVYVTGSRLGITHSVISGNQADGGGGIVVDENSSVTLEKCVIAKNRSTFSAGGIAVVGQNAQMTIMESVVDSNTSDGEAGGLGVYNQAWVRIIDCTISNNTSPRGGGVFIDESVVSLQKCLVTGNSASNGKGGGVYIDYDGHVSIDNCTLHANHATEGGGGIHHSGSIITQIGNTVAWGNTPDNITDYYGDSSRLVVNYSNIGGGRAGLGNINVDPLFVDAEAGDFHLQSVSPCIDAGDPTGPFDPDGTRADMGAFYFHQVPMPEPTLLTVRDIPDDQGGKVLVRWRASILDTNVNVLPHYSVWRVVPEGIAKVAGRTYRIAKINGTSHTWEWVASPLAHRFMSYAYTVPTLYDSTSASSAIHHFMVSAHASDPDSILDSRIVTGYSVDNLPPGAPLARLAGVSSGKISIVWESPECADISHYLVYRGSKSGFDHTLVKPLATTTDTVFADENPLESSIACYLVQAVDTHGNLSPVSNEVTVSPTGVAGVLPTEFALSQNMPNPFNPTTTIRFALPDADRVKLVIYDVIGRPVRNLADGPMHAGYHQVKWNGTNDRGHAVGSGVYFCRLTGDAKMLVRRMVLVK